VLNLIVKEYLTDTGSTHGKLVDLKTARQNMKGVELADKVEESAKQKYLPPSYRNPLRREASEVCWNWLTWGCRKNMLKQGGKKTKKPKKKDEDEDDEEE